MVLADELAYLTATELAARIRRRELSAVEVVEACIERIQARNDSLNALVYLGLMTPASVLGRPSRHWCPGRSSAGG
jgi:Asp-tRNA(Asn)/Glu-tRNA(Gln) amidotransferase A subunit family amidase